MCVCSVASVMSVSLRHYTYAYIFMNMHVSMYTCVCPCKQYYTCILYMYFIIASLISFIIAMIHVSDLRFQIAWKWKSLSHVQPFVTPWAIQCMEFSRPEHWSGSLSLLQGIFPTQGLNPGLPHCRQTL